MLAPFIASPVFQSASHQSYSSIIGAPTELSSVRLPSQAVPSAPADTRLENQRQGSAPLRLPAASSAAPVVTVAAEAAWDFAPPSGPASFIRYSSQFLAQLYAQQPLPRNETLADLYAMDLPKSMLDARVMSIFTQVKYKPSNAAKPLDVAMSQASAQLAAAQAKQAASSGAPPTGLQNLQGELFLRTPSNDNRPRARTEPTLVQSSGVQAYSATLKRNADFARPARSSELAWATL